MHEELAIGTLRFLAYHLVRYVYCFLTISIFHIVLAITLAAQVLIVELGGKALMTSPIGAGNYAISIICAAGALGWGIFFRVLTYHIRRARAKQDAVIEKIE